MEPKYMVNNFLVSTGFVLILILALIVVICFVIYAIISSINEKYFTFINEHSKAIKILNEINDSYSFFTISDTILKNSYDNSYYYDNISCEDYLTYYLAYNKKDVSITINNIYENKRNYKRYVDEINERCILNRFDISTENYKEQKLKTFEKIAFNKKIKKPVLDYLIYVDLKLTNINGAYLSHKSNNFRIDEIRSIIKKLNQKMDGYYLDYDTWQAISRVERGKVTNRMRFAIYERDHYRCRKCGRRTQDLEIDHIIPIAKGGKTTYNNLQTLCHECNAKKGANIE